MTEPPDGSPWGPQYDDRRVHAASGPHDRLGEPRMEGREPHLEGPLHALSRAAWQAVLAAGVASLILGILVLVWPGASAVAAGVLFGIYLLVSGVLQLISAFGTHRATSLRVLAFISGALSILLGLFCFRGAMQSILLLALWIGIGWLIRGITQTMAAVSDKSMPARGWQIFLGIVTFFAGIVLIDSPFESIAVLTLVGGIWLIVVGVTEIITAFRIRSGAQNVPRIL